MPCTDSKGLMPAEIAAILRQSSAENALDCDDLDELAALCQSTAGNPGHAYSVRAIRPNSSTLWPPGVSRC